MVARIQSSSTVGSGLTVLANGNVGIGTTGPSQVLEVIGTIKATDILLTSDARAKSKITSLSSENSLQKVCSMRPVSFKWNHNGKPDLGVIAQEVREIFPELVIQNPDGSLSVRYNALVAPLIGSVQELNKKNQTLEIQNRTLASEASELKKEVEDLRKDNEKMKSDIQMILNKLNEKK